ncbi:PD-(D/E)XK motif protein [Mesobacillus boroniphilus]|uniref:PD-(D/E)XK motif protein n=1 Tax=Mesobacillus boroniphilus TaxID=308892 RepID=A0A944CII4_9BACI|nr:PD-(D/E)XK motif protein [Mesobacillus boroniphilus]MBS8263850.1 PD-(D/E)XK motif protein [Mesobacillus boroniphilus]
MEKIDPSIIWGELEKHSFGLNNGVIKRLIIPSFKYRIYLALEVDTNKRAFILEAPYKFFRNLGPLPQTMGFDAVTRQLGDEEENNLSLILLVKNRNFIDIFNSLVKDVIENITVCKSGKIVEVLIGRLIRWQKFLDEEKVNKLDGTSQRGLFGELLFIKRLIEKSKLDPNYIIKSWTGPEMSVNDFNFWDCSVEIKTSISKQHQKINIANERQLDDSHISKLFLCHYSLDNQSLAGQTLNDLISDVRNLLDTNSAVLYEFENKLKDAGYFDFHYKEYEMPYYSIRETNFFNIVEGFPRIIEKDLIDGVGDIRYTISLAACRDFLTEEDIVVKAIRSYRNE